MRGDITLSQFETRFMRVWEEARARGERNPKPVEDLFHYVQNYVADRDLFVPGSSDVDYQQLHRALRRADANLAPKGALGLMRWFAALPLYIALIGATAAQEVAPLPAPPPPNSIAVLEECVRARAEMLEISREAADLVATAAIQKCSRELTAATSAGGQPRSLAEARQQLKDAMREIAITEVVDIRTARYTPPPPPAKAEEIKPAPKKVVRRKTAPKAPATATASAPQP
jgi:hypothetical protein